MIPRYSTEAMNALWSEKNKLEIWFNVEILAVEGMAKLGLVPQSVVDEIKSKVVFNPERILEIEAEVKHDVIAFLSSLTEKVGDVGRYLHMGMTSSDLLDTSFAVQLKKSGEIIKECLESLVSSMSAKAVQYKNTPCMGRTHGIHAEPTTFGLKLLTFVAELKRRQQDLNHAIKQISFGKISGPVGTYSNISPAVEKYVLEKLGLEVDPVSTQIVNRDRHAVFFNTLAMIGTSLERFAVEVRHLQRTEVGEAQEGFTKGQKGSSSMPHKRNPILSENITGLARLLRGYSSTAMENVALWHERDISHSSAERVLAPDSCTLMHFMLVRAKDLVDNLQVNQDRMLANLEINMGAVFSGTFLNELVKKGISREQGYAIVQKASFAAQKENTSLKDQLLKDKDLQKILSNNEINELFDLKRHFKEVDGIFARVL